MNIADKIDLLFKTVTKPNGKAYSYQDIAELGGGVVTRAAIWKARTGRTKNPSQRLLGALSRAFQVPVQYFFDEQFIEEDTPRYQEQHRNERLVEQIKLQASDLSDDGKQVILDILDLLLKFQRVNDEGDRRGG